MSLKDFEQISQLGHGSYSTVHKIRRRTDGNIYALKQCKLDKLNQKERQNALNEIRILASIHNNYVVSYKEAFFDNESDQLWLIMEYADAGDLYQKVVECSKVGLYIPEEWLWRTFLQIVRGLKSLHDINILHRDIKSANVFLFKNMLAKLGDFNVSKVAKAGMLNTQTGTPYYASPEVWRDRPYDLKSDIWSLGWVMYEAWALKPPFRADNMHDLFKKITKGKYPRIPRIFSNDMVNLIKSLLHVNPNLRPTCEQILAMPLVQRHMLSVEIEFSEERRDTVSLLDTIYLPPSFEEIEEKLPAASYDDGPVSFSEPSPFKSNGLNLPNISMTDKIGKTRNITPTLVRESYRERMSKTPVDELTKSTIKVKRSIIKDNISVRLPRMLSEREKRDYSAPRLSHCRSRLGIIDREKRPVIRRCMPKSYRPQISRRLVGKLEQIKQ